MILRRYQRTIIAVIFAWTLLYLASHFSALVDPHASWSRDTGHAHASGSNSAEMEAEKPKEKELVVASMAADDTSWLDEFFGDWTKNVYVVNNRSAPLTVPMNKGREAMPFLTYIVDRYDTLPDVSIFIHSLRYQWHNEDPMYDGVPVLKRLRLPHVQERGYVALRCSWTMGCPAELHPTKPSSATDDRSQNEQAYASVFKHLFPGEPVPEAVGAHCSSQFAVSRDRIHAHPKAKYEEIREWLMETELDDQISGRVIEYMWHIIFGMPAVDCQDAGECFCQTFGLCNLTCSNSACEKRYQLPKYATIPDGWPNEGPGTDGFPAKGWAD